MKTNTLLLLQAGLSFLQVVNGAIGTITHNATVVVLVGAFFVAFQSYVQNIGNKTMPESK